MALIKTDIPIREKVHENKPAKQQSINQSINCVYQQMYIIGLQTVHNF